MKFNTLFIAFTVIAMSQFSISCSDDNDSDGGGGSGYSNSTAKVFDGAEGCGKNATGGRGGAVYAVTSLEDGRDYSTQAPISGTLRWALEQPNAKQIVFRVAGTIKLKTPLSIGSNVTIFGQSAPGGGICIAPAEEFSIGRTP